MRIELCILFLLTAFIGYATDINDDLWDAQDTHTLDIGFTETPAQIQGPFYPVKLPKETSSDLTVIGGHEALGQKVYILGQVKDTNGDPIVGAKVEIWQACAAGSYNHPRDANPAPRDPNFEYYASVLTGFD